jgi:hypothetical protein
MQSWLNKFKDADGIGERLRNAAPPAVAPDDLYEDIMLSIRGDSTVPRERSPRSRLLWISAAGFAALVIVALMFFNRPARDSHALQVAAVALQQSESLAQNAPANALSPLNDELESLKRDLNGAVEFVIASVP